VRSWQLVGFGFILMGVFDLSIFGIPVLWLNLMLLVLVGLPLVGLDVGAITLFQNSTEDRFRGRIMGTYSTTSGLLLILGRTLATILGGQFDVVLLMCSASVFYLLTGALALRYLRDPSDIAARAAEEDGAQATATASMQASGSS
jgi:hypothetical protein